MSLSVTDCNRFYLSNVKNGEKDNRTKDTCNILFSISHVHDIIYIAEEKCFFRSIEAYNSVRKTI